MKSVVTHTVTHTVTNTDTHTHTYRPSFAVSHEFRDEGSRSHLPEYCPCVFLVAKTIA